MPRRDLFAVLMKVIGVWEFVHGLQALPLVWRQTLHYLQWNNDAEFTAMLVSLVTDVAGVRLLSGVVLFLTANWLARKIYPASDLGQSPSAPASARG